MAGLFGIFGRKQNREKDTDAYFLSNDDAKTFGDIDFMRQSKKVKRSFPNTIKGKGAKIVQEVSSLGKIVTKNDQITESISSVKSVESAPKKETQDTSFSPKRRSAGNDMDMFRKMAQDIKK